MKKLSLILPWLLLTCFLVMGATTVKQVIGPTSATTQYGVVRWFDNSAYKLTNSVVTIDDLGNISGIGTQTSIETDVATAYVTNGYTHLQKSSPPTAAQIGGTVGSITNHYIQNSGGILYDYWTDGTTLYGPKQIAP